MSWIPPQLSVLEIITSSLLLLSGTHIVSPRSSFLRLFAHYSLENCSRSCAIWHHWIVGSIPVSPAISHQRWKHNLIRCHHRTPCKRKHGSWSPIAQCYWCQEEHCHQSRWVVLRGASPPVPMSSVERSITTSLEEVREPEEHRPSRTDPKSTWGALSQFRCWKVLF